MNRVEALKEILDTMIGHVVASGMHSIDLEHFENLDVLHKVILHLLNKVTEAITINANSYESSVQSQYNKAQEILKDISNILEEFKDE